MECLCMSSFEFVCISMLYIDSGCRLWKLDHSKAVDATGKFVSGAIDAALPVGC